MNYLESSLLHTEYVEYKAKISLFIFVWPSVLLLLGLLLFAVGAEIRGVGVLLLLLGVFSLVRRAIIYFNSIYAVTDKRVILKTGFISRRSVELLLTKCEGLHINQGLGGRIFNFGTISVTTGGVTSSYPFIADPLRFRRKINAQIELDRRG